METDPIFHIRFYRPDYYRLRFIKSLLFVILTLTLACTVNPVPEPSESYTISVSSNLAPSVPQPEYNKATEAGVALGKMLFYDPVLSGNNTVSCASCHVQQAGFSDAPRTFSKGVSGVALLRNSPALFNLAWASGYFWDGGATNLESQVFAPLQNTDEMNQDLTQLVTELKRIPAYPPLFASAFGSDSITSSKIARAMAQFERTLISCNSLYDKFVRNEEGIGLNETETKGLQLFTEKCTSCHKPDFFTDFGYHNNGLDTVFNDDSHENLYKGRYRITGNSNDMGKYKTPSLRNVSLTAPYMHDGRFATLEDVIEHYSGGIKISPTLDAQLKTGNKNGFQFTTDEKAALMAFLKTLTDYDFIANAAFSNPHK